MFARIIQGLLLHLYYQLLSIESCFMTGGNENILGVV